MAAYATITDLQARMARTMTADELRIAPNLLDDAGAMIDASAKGASAEAKMVVSCRMVMRALGDGSAAPVPIGASQGSMSGLGYSSSWTIGSGGACGEMYLSKADRLLLGCGNSVGSRSPVEDLSPQTALAPEVWS